MNAVGQHTKNYRPDIDGLRALAVLSVVGFHFFPGFLIPGGFVGVDIFFVISGFLISGIILDDLAENRFSFLRFYARRVRRLFPALILVLTFTFVIGWLVLFPEEYKALGKHIAGGAGFISNILYWRESGYFDAEAATKPLLHLWSLGIEEQFYIFFPLLIFLIWKKGFRTGLFIAILLLVSLTYNFHLEAKDGVADFYSPLSRFWELLIGAVLACLTRSASDSLPRRAVSKINKFLSTLIYEKEPANAVAPLNSLMSATGFALIAYALIFFRNPSVWPGHLALFPSIGAALILAAGMPSFLNRLLLSNPLAVFIGLISYPLYLWHWPIISYLRILSGGMPDRATRIVATLIALALAWLTYKLVERPFRFGQRWKRAKTFILGVMMALFVTIGLFICSNDGLPGRSIKSSNYKIDARGDEACQAYAGIPIEMTHSNSIVDFDFFCRLSSGHGPATVALIGDSHAWSAYFGMEKMNSSLGLNTLLLARGASRNPLLLGLEADKLKERHQELSNHAFKVLKQPEIKAVFIFLNPGATLAYRDKLQSTANTLAQAGKKVFLLTDWPRLPKNGVDYVARPYTEFFKPGMAELQRKLERITLLNKAQKYFDSLRTIENVTLIERTWNAFCPDTECLVFSDTGQLLYFDSHHLTTTGSEFLAEKVLAPYLKEIAATAKQAQ